MTHIPYVVGDRVQVVFLGPEIVNSIYDEEDFWVSGTSGWFNAGIEIGDVGTVTSVDYYGFEDGEEYSSNELDELISYNVVFDNGMDQVAKGFHLRRASKIPRKKSGFGLFNKRVSETYGT